ncbi:MAG TPA: LptF/LptG family permease, partial [Gammaproteobacteria bacterium]|nr:LptF/LptG family permease [Gammaproteobacteria bacterium]
MRKHILQKYLLKEALISFFAVLLVLLLVLLGGVFIQLLSKVAEGSVELGLLLPLLFWGSLKAFSTLLVISLFLSILFSLGRLYKDSEIYAMRASGFGSLQLWMPFLWISGVLALLMALLSFELGPQAEQHVHDLKVAALEKLDLAGITPGRFVELPGQGRVVFAGGLDPESHQLQHLYLFQEKRGHLQIVAATTAEQIEVAQGHEKFLRLSEGEMFEGMPGADRFSLT